MQRYKILHRTYYNFAGQVQLGSHALLLRPREGPELRIESSVLEIRPEATVRWHRDAEDNAVAVATFTSPAQHLAIVSEVIVQRYGTSVDFVVDAGALDYPFAYEPDDRAALVPYLQVSTAEGARDLLAPWVGTLWQPGQQIRTSALLHRVAAQVQRVVGYQRREERGVQAPEVTLNRRLGSCRDSAFLFMEAARRLGFASRFVSGYSCAPASTQNFGATHAWAEVYIPGAGWRGFDPSIGAQAGPGHIAVAVARSPELVPPVAGTFNGPAGASLNVGVWVNTLT
ncbi:MAG TPA: transglutaminase family protein [Polyangiales bacterium]|nr:transglutaminase family protein [Polyangiales bacterium]